MIIKSAKDLVVCQKSYQQAMDVYVMSKRFPPDERYSLTGQARRATRSVCANLREAWARRRYEAHFVSKLTDADGENSEVDTWLDFAKDCGYLTEEEHRRLAARCQEIGKMLGAMIRNPAPFLLTSDR